MLAKGRRIWSWDDYRTAICIQKNDYLPLLAPRNTIANWRGGRTEVGAMTQVVSYRRRPAQVALGRRVLVEDG